MVCYRLKSELRAVANDEVIVLGPGTIIKISKTLASQATGLVPVTADGESVEVFIQDLASRVEVVAQSSAP